jgi:hypothetical protein
MKNNKVKLMEFVRDCDSGAGWTLQLQEVGFALVQWCRQNRAELTSISDPVCVQKAGFFL